jgi:hypothetical protein
VIDRLADLRNRPVGPQKVGPRKCSRVERSGKPGIAGGSYAEKMQSGEIRDEAQGMAVFSATSLVAKVIG